MDLDFSVVIPLYNKAPYIATAVQSALDQVGVSIEIIVVDDGSTDDGADVVNSMADPRIRVIRQPNGGVSSARNNGSKQASAPYIAFLDADDSWHKQHLVTLKHLTDQRTQCGIFGSGYLEYNDLSEISDALASTVDVESSRIEPVSLPLLSHGICNGRSPFWTSALAVKKSAFVETGGFDEAFSHGEDVAVWLAITAAHGGVASDAKTAYYYRGDASSLTQRLVRADGTMDLVNRLLKDSKWSTAERNAMQSISDHFAISHASSALRTHNNKTACRTFLSGVYKRNKRWWLLAIASVLPKPLLTALAKLR
ncbi:MAG: glycosyltransferase family 2 protein [Pseudomonadota bacterium]